MLLMLWSFERFDIGRPTLSTYEQYKDAMYGFDEDGVADEYDAPTMGTLWLCRDVSIVYTQFNHVRFLDFFKI